MNIVINGKNLQKRIINGQEVEKVIRNGVQIRPESVPPTVGPGIYWNNSLGLISISSDNTNWITIQDKNLGASQVYNFGDSMSESNCGNIFQRGNNYAFPGIGNDTTIPLASGNIDATYYGPYNYYNNNLFIQGSRGYSPSNSDMRGYYTYYEDYNYEAIQGPCQSGFHIPRPNEYDSLVSYWESLTNSSTDSDLFSSVFKIPKAGSRATQAAADGVGTIGNYISCFGGLHGPCLLFYNNSISSQSYGGGYGRYIRPFKNNPVVPDSTRIILYQPS